MTHTNEHEVPTKTSRKLPTRLRLDFSLNTNIERSEFLAHYLDSPMFQQKPPTPDELEVMANYVLWGKDPVTGLNAQQEGITRIETKHHTWDAPNRTESLDGLMEMPTFNEAELRPLDAVPLRARKVTFDREQALAESPDYLRPTLIELFREIDELDMAICQWELAHGKREKPPREALAAVFGEEEVAALAERASHWSQFRYLKMRHLLVEKRREAYTMRDSFRPPVINVTGDESWAGAPPPSFGVEVEVLPLGLRSAADTTPLVFRDWGTLVPQNYTEKQLRQISDLVWRKKQWQPTDKDFWFDFRDAEHISELIAAWQDLEDAAAHIGPESTIPQLLATLDYYADRAELGDLLRTILEMKKQKKKNTEIVAVVNETWNKTYPTNYISTLFRQKIIPKIAAAADFHMRQTENLFFEESFKPCNECGRMLLRAPENYTRKSRALDGYSGKCKRCEKANRQKKMGEVGLTTGGTK